MRPTSPPLLPILRSATQAEILVLILLDPTKEWSLTDLAEAIDTSLTTVGREVERAAQVGVVKVKPVGRTKLVSANESSEYFEPLARLLLVGFGPKRRIAEALSGQPGISSAYLYGSWAARYQGVPGPAPKDIDLLIIGNPDRSAIYSAIEPLEVEIGRPVQVTFRSREEWEDRSDSFVATLRSRPLVTLPLERR